MGNFNERKLDQELVWQGYRFPDRAIERMAINGMDIDDVVTVLIQENFDISYFTGSTIMKGRVGRKKAIVVIRPIVERPKRSKACFDIVTAYFV